jgi:hypothetical protein
LASFVTGRRHRSSLMAENLFSAAAAGSRRTPKSGVIVSTRAGALEQEDRKLR